MEGNIQTVLDTRGALRCVRFESGNVGVVTRYEDVVIHSEDH